MCEGVRVCIWKGREGERQIESVCRELGCREREGLGRRSVLESVCRESVRRERVGRESVGV